MRGRSTGSSSANDESGFALILVLWFLAALFLMAGEFAFRNYTEITLTKSFKEENQAYFIALTGIHSAMEEILAPVDYHYMVGEGDIAFHRPRDEEDSDTLSRKASHRENSPIGDGYYSYWIRDNDSKINLNSANEDQLEQMLTVCGMQIGSEMDEVIHSILDWRDADDNHRIGGVEDDHYMELEEPYHCKNGNFDTVEELLLVNGVTDELFHGSTEEEFPGLKDLATVFGRRINKNTASLEVLTSKYDEEAAESIIEEREETAFSGSEGRSNVLEIISTGFIEGSQGKRSIRTVVKGKGTSYEIVWWNDNYWTFASADSTEEQYETD